MSRKGEDAGQHDGYHDGFLHDVFPHKEGCVRFLLAYQMPDTDGAALGHGDAEQISEHDDVDTIGTGGERFYTGSRRRGYQQDDTGHVYLLPHCLKPWEECAAGRG